MKYVIIEQNNCEMPIIFPTELQHSTFQHLNPIAAGEVTFYGADEPLPHACCCENAIRVGAFGKSVSLGLHSRPQDTELIANAIMKHYH